MKAIVEAINIRVEWAKHSCSSKHVIAFVRAGEQLTSNTSAGTRASSRDCQLLVDLEWQLKFPNHTEATTLHPDIVLLSETTKQVVLLELTVPWKDWLEEAFEG